MIISIIAALARQQVIGKGGNLPWSLPADTVYFRSKIKGKSVIMGRKSYQAKDAEFTECYNVVLSQSTVLDFSQKNFVQARNLPDALQFLEKKGEKQVFILGGAGVYALALPLADWLYLTRIEASLGGDTFFPEIDWAQWELYSSESHKADSKNPYSYTFEVYQRRQ